MRARNTYCFQIFELHRNLSTNLLNITPASAAAVRGANFAIAKFRDAYGSPLDAIVYAQHGRELMR